MKKGMCGVGVLALVLITGLSVFYWAQVGKKVVTASTSVNGQELPICSVQTGKKQIAYTFELSGTQNGKGQVEQMLQILQHQEIPATFFATPYWIENHRSLAIQICQQGHEIQGLSEQAVCVEQMTAKGCRKELRKIRETIGTVTEEPCIFSVFPAGNIIMKYSGRYMPVEAIRWHGVSTAWTGKSMKPVNLSGSCCSPVRSGMVRFSASMGKEKIPEKW